MSYIIVKSKLRKKSRHLKFEVYDGLMWEYGTILCGYDTLCLSENNSVILPTIFCVKMLGNGIKSTELYIIVEILHTDCGIWQKMSGYSFLFEIGGIA